MKRFQKREQKFLNLLKKYENRKGRFFRWKFSQCQHILKSTRKEIQRQVNELKILGKETSGILSEKNSIEKENVLGKESSFNTSKNCQIHMNDVANYNNTHCVQEKHCQSITATRKNSSSVNNISPNPCANSNSKSHEKTIHPLNMINHTNLLPKILTSSEDTLEVDENDINSTYYSFDKNVSNGKKPCFNNSINMCSNSTYDSAEVVHIISDGEILSDCEDYEILTISDSEDKNESTSFVESFRNHVGNTKSLEVDVTEETLSNNMTKKHKSVVLNSSGNFIANNDHSALSEEFLCASCHLSFSSEILLQRHQKLHKVRDFLAHPYECKQCSFRTTTQKNLTRHVKLRHKI